MIEQKVNEERGMGVARRIGGRGYSGQDWHDLQGLGPMSWEPELLDCNPVSRPRDQDLVGRRNELSDRSSSPGVPDA